ncbi:hypothetical protein, partial [Pandoraea pnomenusa]
MSSLSAGNARDVQCTQRQYRLTQHWDISDGTASIRSASKHANENLRRLRYQEMNHPTETLTRSWAMSARDAWVLLANAA